MHCKILLKGILSSSRIPKMGHESVFQYDNNPKRNAVAANEWLKKKHIKVMEWLRC